MLLILLLLRLVGLVRLHAVKLTGAVCREKRGQDETISSSRTDGRRRECAVSWGLASTRRSSSDARPSIIGDTNGYASGSSGCRSARSLRCLPQGLVHRYACRPGLAKASVQSSPGRSIGPLPRWVGVDLLHVSGS